MMARLIFFMVLALFAFSQGRIAAADESADLIIEQARLGNIFLDTEAVRIPVRSAGSRIAWTIEDYFGLRVADGIAPVGNGRAVIEPELGRYGYFEMTLTAERAGKTIAEAQTTFAVIRPSVPTELGSSRFGVMTHFAQGWNTDVIPLIAKAGIRHVRDEQYWKSVERKPSEYAFSEEYTGYMEALSAHDIEPLIIMSFANELYDDGMTPHTDTARQAFARYGRAILDRYDDQIRTLEVWNEYNGSFAEGPATDDRPRYYTRMLERAYQEIKSARPDVQVLGGAVVKVPLPYLERLFQHGALEYMDAVAVHPYQTQPEGIEVALNKLKALIERYNDGTGKPIWVTESGRQDKSPDGRHNVARYLVRAYTLMLSEEVERIYWYLLRDYDKFQTMGLLRGEDSPLGRYVPTPAYVSYANLIRQLDGARYVRREATDPRTRLYLFEKNGEEIRVGWSMETPARIVFQTSAPLAVTDIMGREHLAPPADGEVVMLLTDNPVYIKGPVTEVRESGRDKILADSESDIGNLQGENGWYYGYYDGDGDGEGDGLEPAGPYTDDDFEQLTWTESEWGYSWASRERSNLSVAGSTMHPSATKKGPVFAVRRWKSSIDGTIRIAGTINRSSSRGDGAQARILVGGVEVFSMDLGADDRQAELTYALSVTVSKGTTVDLALTPGPGTDVDHDATAWTARILYP